MTTRTQQGRFLLRPHPDLREIVLGVLARAQRLYLPPGSGICAFTFLSNHYHLLLRVDNAGQLAAFMRYVNSNLAREVARLVDWRDHVWARRYQAIVVSHEPEAQEARLRYILSQGVKEGLVAYPADWPGANTARALVEDQPLEGYWFDRTQEYFARRRREEFSRLRYATRESLSLVSLPCWDTLDPTERRERAKAIVDEITTTCSQERRGKRPLGAAHSLLQQAHDRPRQFRRSPAPAFHTASRPIRLSLLDSYRDFSEAYRGASRLWRAGLRDVSFPAGSFPPALPFVGG